MTMTPTKVTKRPTPAPSVTTMKTAATAVSKPLAAKWHNSRQDCGRNGSSATVRARRRPFASQASGTRITLSLPPRRSCTRMP